MGTVLELSPATKHAAGNGGDSSTHGNTAQSAQLERPLVVALAGNPNAGKTSLFNALTGLRQKVANYPGVTVERKEGQWPLAPHLPPARLIDLPGLYSLDATSIDERIARDVLLGHALNVPAPDVIVAAVDATNLERNLYLVTQLFEYQRPIVVALTMVDLAERRGLEIDIKQLAANLGVSVVVVTAPQRRGIDELAHAVAEAASSTQEHLEWKLSEQAEIELACLSATNQTLSNGATTQADWHAALHELYAEELPKDAERRTLVKAARERLTRSNPDWWQEPLVARYKWIERITTKAVRGGHTHSHTSWLIDRVATHKVFGPLLLVGLMLLIFQAIYSWAQPAVDSIDNGFNWLGQLIHASLPAGLLADLMVDGVIAGVGGILVFLPQILLLFFFVAILEDSGYMARAAFLMDRLMRGVGLHGKAFMPLLSSFACAIPGIMATRTIENSRDRLATILIAPLMSCSARLPVYGLMIGAFFADQTVFGFISAAPLIIMAMYLLGIVVAVIVAWVLKHTILRAPAPPLVMELPPYRLPNISTVGQTLWLQAWMFVRRAGTVILAISIILWALVTFPRTSTVTDTTTQSAVAQQTRETGVEGNRQGESESGSADAKQSGEQLRNSFAGRAGRLIEPAIRPLGFDWQMGIGLITSFAARETLVPTLSIVYNNGPDADENSTSLVDAVKRARRPDGTRAWTPLVAVSMMVFFVLACQCMSTVAVVRRETNSWRWPLFMVAYMLALAYLASLLTYQGGRFLGFS